MSLRKLFAVFCLVVAGCGGPSLGTPVEVSGTVTLDGEPLAEATVGFSAISKGLPAKYRYASAVTDDSGNYSIKEVYPAEYMVTLSQGEAPEPDPTTGMVPATAGNPALDKYSATNSQLKAEVSATSTTHDFQLESKK